MLILTLGLGAFMAILAAGRGTVLLVALFAGFVECVLDSKGFRFGAVTAGAFAGFHTFVMAGLAVSYLALMGGMVEGDFAHLVGKLDFGGAVVGSDNNSTNREERNSDEESD